MPPIAVLVATFVWLSITFATVPAAVATGFGAKTRSEGRFQRRSPAQPFYDFPLSRMTLRKARVMPIPHPSFANRGRAADALTLISVGLERKKDLYSFHTQFAFLSVLAKSVSSTIADRPVAQLLTDTMGDLNQTRWRAPERIDAAVAIIETALCTVRDILEMRQFAGKPSRATRVYRERVRLRIAQ